MSIIKADEMRVFLDQTIGSVAAPEVLYDEVAFKIEQNMLEDVRSLQDYLFPWMALADNDILFDFERL